MPCTDEVDINSAVVRVEAIFKIYVFFSFFLSFFFLPRCNLPEVIKVFYCHSLRSDRDCSIKGQFVCLFSVFVVSESVIIIALLDYVEKSRLLWINR